MRYFLELSYDGKRYHGWQIQNNALTVQEVLNDAISTLLRAKIEVTGSGRTDTGVHASKQVAHFDVDQAIRDDFGRRLNNLLPKDIAVSDIREVKSDSHTRFDAESRAYTYQIHQRKSPFLQDRSYYFSKPLDLVAMNDCCKVLLDWEDFECFSKVHTEVNNFLCKIFKANWQESNDGLIFYVCANRFLRGMVRAMVGTLLLVGEGRLDKQGFIKILESKDRKAAGRSVPAHGLYLCEVKYPKEIYL